MTIFELGDMFDMDLVITKYANQKDRWVASFSGLEIKEDKESSILASSYGDSNSPYHAIEQYRNSIQGKYGVLNATSKEMRREFHIPKSLVMSYE